MKVKNIWFIFLILILSLALTSSLLGQQGRGRGRVRGTVQDDAGNPIEGVKIVAEHLQYKTTFESNSDKKGSWAIAGLGTGYFRITASKEGYGTVYHEMKVSQFSKKNPSVDFTLKKVQVVPLNMPAIQDESAVAVFDEGNLLFEKENYSEAIAKFEEFLSKNPSVYQVYINIGNCYREMGEYDKALEAYQKILDKVKTEERTREDKEMEARALANIGQTYIKQGDLEKANEFLKLAVDIFPEDETLAFNVGEIYFKQGAIDEAIEYYKIAIKIKDTWSPPYRQLGYAYLNKGEYELAVDALKKFLEVAPDDPQAETIRNLIPKLEGLIKK
ncbi:MAG: tetratricopeptide repeat protein [Candidatus Aminicenantes bacterium]|nr:tetratricopeptide repeat protein [Candidatus Aminicenantes bacterium]